MAYYDEHVGFDREIQGNLYGSTKDNDTKNDTNHYYAHNECICEGNWRLIVGKMRQFFDRKYVNDKGEEFVFYGIVYAANDFYYGMHRAGQCYLLSCVGSIEGHGYTLVKR